MKAEEEKARNLVETFEHETYSLVQGETAKQCAIIHCNLMIDFCDEQRIFEEIKNFNLLKNEINNL